MAEPRPYDHVYAPTLVPGRLQRRYKRFLADVVLDTGELVTAHCMNTGSMRGLVEEGSEVWLQSQPDPRRKLKWSWEIASEGGVRVGVNTHLANRLVHDAVAAQAVEGVRGYVTLRREVRYGAGSRIDLFLTDHASDPRPCYLEVKNVTLRDGDRARFPDAVTARGLKHLHELAAMVGEGARSVMCFLVQRGDVASFAPADDIDPTYGRALREVVDAGVEAMALQVEVLPTHLAVVGALPVELR